MGIFRIVIIFFLVYLVVRMLGRMFFPGSGSSSNPFNSGDNPEKKSREGDVSLENNDINNKKHLKKDVGDYVDFEEVD